ncbi:hypothetical protein ACFZBP_02575 [Streptomyces sp. NPDC008086]
MAPGGSGTGTTGGGTGDGGGFLHGRHRHLHHRLGGVPQETQNQLSANDG